MNNPKHSSPLQALAFSLTDRCPSRCAFCRAGASPEGKRFLPLEAFLEGLQAFRPAFALLSGGEPLLHPQLERMVAAARERGILVSLITSGRPGARLRSVAGWLHSAVIGLDSADPAGHDRSRGQRGAHRAALEAMEACAEGGALVIAPIIIPLMPLEEVVRAACCAVEHGAGAINLRRIMPVGRAEGAGPGGMEGVVEAVLACRRELPGGVAVTFEDGVGAIHLGLALEEAGEELMEEEAPQGLGEMAVQAGCGAGITLMAMGPSGEIWPCLALPLAVGQVGRGPLERQAAASPLIRALRSRRVGGACGACPEREGCGGCRARAYQVAGDPLGGDPGCPLRAPTGPPRRSAGSPR